MPSVFEARLDREQEKRMLRGYSSEAVDHILRQAAKVGGDAAKTVVRAGAPIGTSTRLSQYYRKMRLTHGTFQRSVRAAAIRGRGSMIKGLQGNTVGYVIGPIGKNAFTRAWIELGTVHQRARPWIEPLAAAALSVARSASEAVLDLYVRAH